MRISQIQMGLFVLSGLIFVAITATWIAPFDATAIDLQKALLPPSAQHWMGTDALGRDVLSRMLYGTQISMLVGMVAVGISTVIGLLLGAAAGYLGGKTDTWIMRMADVFLCFPTLFLILAVIAFLEPNILNIMAVIGLTSWMGVARLIRAEVLSLKEREFVLYAKATGASLWWIMRKHLIPNALSPLMVSITFGIATAILIESGLSFLGIGVQPPTASWGSILTEGKQTLGIAWWLTFFPGVAIFVTILACNLLGEGLKQKTDTR